MSGRFKSTANNLVKNFKKLDMDINKDEFANFINDAILEPTVQKYERAGRDAMRTLRCQAMSTWITSKKSGRYIAYDKSIRFAKSNVCQSNDGKNIEITINSYIDIATFDAVFNVESTAYASIYDWVNNTRSYDDPNKHVGHINDGWYGTIYEGSKPTSEHFVGKAIAMPYSIGEYVLHNMWDLGYTSLPPKETATGTHWENPKPSNKKPLKDDTESLFNKKWKKAVMDSYNKNI